MSINRIIEHGKYLVSAFKYTTNENQVDRRKYVTCAISHIALPYINYIKQDHSPTEFLKEKVREFLYNFSYNSFMKFETFSDAQHIGELQNLYFADENSVEFTFGEGYVRFYRNSNGDYPSIYFPVSVKFTYDGETKDLKYYAVLEKIEKVEDIALLFEFCRDSYNWEVFSDSAIEQSNVRSVQKCLASIKEYEERGGEYPSRWLFE